MLNLNTQHKCQNNISEDVKPGVCYCAYLPPMERDGLTGNGMKYQTHSMTKTNPNDDPANAWAVGQGKKLSHLGAEERESCIFCQLCRCLSYRRRQSQLAVLLLRLFIYYNN